MKALVCLLLLALVGIILAEDVAKEPVPKNPVAAEKKEVRYHRLTPEEKRRLSERKKEYLSLHPELKLDSELAHQDRRLRKDRREKIIQIKKSDLTLEEKKAKLKELKKEYGKHRKGLIASSRRRQHLTAEEKRTLVAQRKEGMLHGAINKQSRMALKKTEMRKPNLGLAEKKSSVDAKKVALKKMVKP